jgi:phage-related protein (TIGR01555 family)
MSDAITGNARNDSELRIDGALTNVLTGMGVPGKDRKLGNSIRINALLSENQLEELYKNGLIRRYIDAIPEAILRHHPTITLGSTTPEDENTDLIPDFNRFLQASHFDHALREVVQLQRLYGGAGLVLLLDDGGTPEEPVNLKTLRGVRGYVPLSRHELIPEDVSFTDYSKPEHYRISTNQRLEPGQTESYVNTLIHSSRVARFDGLYLPWNLRARNTGWGMSCIEVIWDAFQNYEGALSGLNSLLSEGDLLVHKIPGLMQRIASGGEADIRKRLEINNLARSVYGALVVDKEEEVTNISRGLNNLAQATEPFVNYLQAVTGWPASILMGDSPGGLGKEGRFEERVWASLVESWQEVYCRLPVSEIFTYILASKEGPAKGRPPETWDLDFPSVFTQTDEERAELYGKMAIADNTYVQLGVLNAIEIRQSRFGSTDFSIDTQLNETITQRIAEQEDMQFQQQLAGFAAQMQAAQGGGLPPEAGGVPEGEDGAAPTAGDNDPGGIVPPDVASEPADEPPESDEDRRRRRGLAFDALEAHGLRIRVTHERGDSKAGYLIGPDGQRLDTSESAPFMIFGPHRTKAYKLYKARFINDAELIDGPYVTGFASMKAAKNGVSAFYPRQTVAGLSAISAAEIESLRAGWETY